MLFFLQLAVVLTNYTLLLNAKPLESLNNAAHEIEGTAPQGWKRKDRVHKDTILPVRIGLAQKNLEKGHSFLMDVSDPRSLNYGKHWSTEKVHEAFAPSTETVKEVKEWLSSFGIPSHGVVHSENKGWLAFDARAHEVEKLLSTEYHEHEHISGEVRVGTDKYYVPPHIQKHVDYITPGVRFSAPLKKRAKKRSVLKRQGNSINASTPSTPGDPQSLAHCDTDITPACIKALYQIPDSTRASPTNSLGIFEEQSFAYSQEDLDMFFTSYAPNVPNGTHPTPAFIDGGTAPVSKADADAESDIDFAITLSLIYPQSITLYQTDDPAYRLGFTGLNGLFNTFLDALDGSYCTYSADNITGNSPGIDPVYPDPQPNGYNGTLMCGLYTPTNVISISYGIAEADQPPNYLQRQCNEFMKLSLQGHTILVSSGDNGVAADPNDPGGNGKIGCIGGNQTVFNPETPACPYVTVVGATRLYSGQTVADPESALQQDRSPRAPLFATSGGFSNIFPVPDYQAEAVNSFLSANKFPFPSYNVTAGDHVGAHGGVFNIAGRGMPDVSANGALIDSYVNGLFRRASGTSFSTPIWASIITLINEARIAVGKGPVGFINPVLYQHTEVFNDIKNGSNPGCHSEGFHAVDGWDPLTGLGTPQYPLLEQLFLSLP